MGKIWVLEEVGMETLSLSCPSPMPRAFALLGSGPVAPSWYSVVHTSHWMPGHRQICPESGPCPVMLIAQVPSTVLSLGSTTVSITFLRHPIWCMNHQMWMIKHIRQRMTKGLSTPHPCPARALLFKRPQSLCLEEGEVTTGSSSYCSSQKFGPEHCHGQGRV